MMTIRKILLARPPPRRLLAASRPRPRPSATRSRAISTRSTPTRLTRPSRSALLGNVMEGLTKRDKDLKIIPGLAERWETLGRRCAGASTCART